ncbi:MAG TPA: helix-turn-helix domain-containing protein [Croceibacterium sp.]
MPEEFEQQPLPLGVGERLRAAREARGLTLAQVANETRIPQRHLQTIEAGEFAKLPARTYAISFAKNYARMVGLDQQEVAAMVRGELNVLDPSPRARPAGFEPGDPARVPSRALGWISVAAVVLVLAGVVAFASTFFAPAAELPSLIEPDSEQAAPQRQAAAARPPAPAPTGGAVVFTALEEGIWVKFYDAQGRQLMQKQMALNERYTVPADASGPQLWTGRPDALAITIGGRPVPRLAEQERVVRDVPVTAEALLARPPATGSATSPQARPGQAARRPVAPGVVPVPSAPVELGPIPAPSPTT